MYNLPFNDNYILRYPFHTPYMTNKFGINQINYINVGVMRIGINKIREDNKDIESI